MEQDTGSSSTVSLWHEVKAVPVSASFLVGAAILVGSAVVGLARDVPGVLFLGFIGYLVAGLLAPPRPWATGMLLALVHAATALGWWLAEPASSDPLFQLAAGFTKLSFLVGIAVGVFVTGLVGHLVVRWLRTGAR